MPDATPPISTPSIAQCLCCERVARELPKTARFCPACGTALPDGDFIQTQTPTLAERLEHFQFAFCDHTSGDASTQEVAQLHSLVLLGYANAMLQLGWRYEHGRGVERNAAEAERCYAKSSKLGNIYARAKLADDAMDLSKEDPVPAELIPGEQEGSAAESI